LFIIRSPRSLGSRQAKYWRINNINNNWKIGQIGVFGPSTGQSIYPSWWNVAC